jgi:hypothetical protein
MYPAIISFWNNSQGDRITIWQMNEGGYLYQIESRSGASKLVQKSYDEVKLALQQRGYTEEDAEPEVGVEKVEETSVPKLKVGDYVAYDHSNGRRTPGTIVAVASTGKVKIRTTWGDGKQTVSIVTPEYANINKLPKFGRTVESEDFIPESAVDRRNRKINRTK